MTSTSDTLSRLVIETFRLGDALSFHGDHLVADIGLTLARWSVLGQMDLEKKPASVAQLARNLRLSRQAVQRIANEMRACGLVEYQANPHHARAQLVVFTPEGREALAGAMQRQDAWMQTIKKSLPDEDVAGAIKVLVAVRELIEQSMKQEGSAKHDLEKHH
jgi:DNA-binding MarR family transcriptional regulator